MCFALPVLDTAFVILSRLKAGLPPMSADKRHFHHTLVQLGLTQSQSVTLMYFLCIAAGTMGLAPLIYPSYPVAWVPLCGAILIFLTIGSAMVLNIRWRDNWLDFSKKWQDRVLKESPRFATAIRIWERINKYCLFIALSVSPIFAGNIPTSVGYIAIPVLILLISTAVLRPRANDFLESLAISLTCFTLVVANNQNPLQVIFMGKLYPLQPLYNMLFGFMLISSIGFMIFTFRRKHLVLNASDFLMISFPLLLTLMPEDFKLEFRIEVISLRCLVVYLCYRTLEKRRINARRHIRMGTAFALVYLIATSLFGLRVVY
jgi:UDP-GlcNAc:undecaprenyl-phosphate GlcNAc-1-phosphate transferase